MVATAMKPPRIPLYDFPDVVMHAADTIVLRHQHYRAAKAGDIVAADRLVADLVNSECVDRLNSMLTGYSSAELVSVHALETEGVNEIPAALGKWLAKQSKLTINDSIVQSNSVGHTKADGFHRLAHQAAFFGEVRSGQHYLIVDDFVGQGGTLANLIGFIHSRGGRVLGATVLTGRAYSVKLAPDAASIQTLRRKHGQELEEWWRQEFGFGFDCLTRSEARYLEKTPNAQTIRDRLVAAGLEGSS
jgi:hypothetical protein